MPLNVCTCTCPSLFCLSVFVCAHLLNVFSAQSILTSTDGGWVGRLSFPHEIVSYNMQCELRQLREGDESVGVVQRMSQEGFVHVEFILCPYAILDRRGSVQRTGHSSDFDILNFSPPSLTHRKNFW